MDDEGSYLRVTFTDWPIRENTAEKLLISRSKYLGGRVLTRLVFCCIVAISICAVNVGNPCRRFVTHERTKAASLLNVRSVYEYPCGCLASSAHAGALLHASSRGIPSFYIFSQAYSCQ